MPSRRREDALSEVIGFILILALIAVLASLYLTYVVPAQGREAEIRHMAEINDQFLGYKTGIDSLWINDQANVPISRTFTLGTLTGLTQGAFVVPLFQPYPSSGTMLVNGNDDIIDIALTDWKKTVSPADYGHQETGIIQNGIPIDVIQRPNHIYIILNTTSVTIDNPQLQYTLSKSDAQPSSPQTVLKDRSGILLQNSGQNWSINIEFSPRYDTIYLAQETQTQNQILNFQYKLLDTDLRMIVNVSRNIPAKYLSQEFILNKSISSNTNYAVDLMEIFDGNYGISPQINYPLVITPNFIQSGVNPYNINARYIIDYGYQQDASSIPGYPHAMGYLKFRSNNNYWIQQDFSYQNGGVFLYQPEDQSGVAKVIPLISVENVSNTPYLLVKVVDISLSGTGNIGGTSPVQVITSLEQSREQLIRLSDADNLPNARNITITLDLQEFQRAQMWHQAFSNIKQLAISKGVDSSYINIPPIDNNTVQFNVNNTYPEDYNIFFELLRVNTSVELQPVAIAV